MLEEGNQGVNSGGFEGLITPNQSPKGLSLATRLESCRHPQSWKHELQ